MLIDLHVHTSRYSACGNSTPEEMAAAALAHGLDGIVLTEHNVTWPDAELVELRAAYPDLAIFGGIELTSDRGDDYLVLGLPHEPWFAPGLPAAEIVDRTRAQGGVVILAHPYRYKPDLPDSLTLHPVDGVEVASCNMHASASEGARRLVASLGVFPVWDSDAHHSRNVGLYANRFECAITDEAELAQALLRRVHHAYADERRIRAINKQWDHDLPVIGEMISSGASDEAIRAAVGTHVGYSDLYAIRAGLEVRRTLSPVEVCAMPAAR